MASGYEMLVSFCVGLGNEATETLVTLMVYDTIVLHSYFDRIGGDESGFSIFDCWADENEMHSSHYVIYEFTLIVY